MDYLFNHQVYKSITPFNLMVN